jgi:hypothetical protein
MSSGVILTTLINIFSSVLHKTLCEEKFCDDNVDSHY